MSRPDPKYRRPLNNDQLNTLLALYKFRFATVKLLTIYFGSSSVNIQKKLARLLDQNYIARHYSAKDKITGRGARYYLDTKGLKTLKTLNHLNPQVLSKLSRNSRLSLEFQNHCLNLFETYLKFKNHYGNKLDFLTNTDLANQPDLPNQLDALIIVNKQPKTLLLLVDTNQPIDYRLRQIIEFLGELKQTHLDLLIVCHTENRAKRLQRSTDYKLRRAGLDTTVQATILSNLVIT